MLEDQEAAKLQRNALVQDIEALLDYVQDDGERDDFHRFLLEDGRPFVAGYEDILVLEEGTACQVQKVLERVAETNPDVPHIWAAAHRVRKALETAFG